MSPSGKKIVLLLVALCLVALASTALYNRYFPASGTRSKTTSAADEAGAASLGMPDALIRSSSLSKLPPDLLRLPLAKDILTEDIVNYYEHHDGKLALSGTLRRIAYENKLQLPERLIEMALDAPAEVALWNDDEGRLHHFAVAMTENALARAITLLLPLHSKVTSTKKWPEIDATSLAVAYGHEHLILFTRGDRVVMVSDSLLPVADDEGKTEGDSGKSDSKSVSKNNSSDNDDDVKRQQEMVRIVNALLAGKNDQTSTLAKSFNLTGGLPVKGHEIVISAKALSLGYARFTPGFDGFRFVFASAGDGQDWQSAILLNGQAATTPYAPLWRALPHGAAFCASLPVDWSALADVALQWRVDEDANRTQQAGEILAKFGPAAVCWYGDSRLYTPLFATFSPEKLSTTEKETLLQLSQEATKVEQPDESFNKEDGGMWRGSVPSDYGVSQEDKEGQQSGKRLYPAVAIWSFTMGQGAGKDVALFSPDAALVKKALEVAAKKFPALSDDAPVADSERIIAFVNPDILAKLMRQEIFSSTPQGAAENFLGIADFLFTPRLQALAGYAPQWISFDTGKSSLNSSTPASQWYPLRWNRATGASITNTNASATSASATESKASETGAAAEAKQP